MPDGKQFLGVVNPERAQSAVFATPRIQVVLNWFSDLKKRAPASAK
jgi:hypothetical protein